jgi:hypothetical protein
MASYSLLSSHTTVQVLGPRVSNPVEYCTIVTNPSSVIASIPVSIAAFSNNQAQPELEAFGANIETLMGRGHVIAAQGAQTLDPLGLLQDQVAFIVEYVPTGPGSTSITAEALVPVNLLSIDDPAIDRVLLNEAEAIIDGVYGNLQSAAGG